MPIQKSKTKKRVAESEAAPASPSKRRIASQSPEGTKRPKSGRRSGGFSSAEEDTATAAITVPAGTSAPVAANVEVVSSPTAGPKKRGRPRKNADGSGPITSDTEVASPPPGTRSGKRTPAARKKKQEQAEADAAVAAVEAAGRDDVGRQIAPTEIIEEQVVVEEVAQDDGTIVQAAIVEQQADQNEEDLPPLDQEVGVVHNVENAEPVATVSVIEQTGDQQENYLVVLENGEVTSINPADAVALGLATADGTTVYTTEDGKIVEEATGVEAEPPYPQDPAMLCPICSDSNSGYHYGIFACESCKGFFKRAIQNNRQLRCNFTGNCDITIATRKRCAACRLRKCLLAGMKVEAIRLDRRRGGRSVYIGPPPLPHFRPQRYIKSSTGLKPYRSDQLLQAEAQRLLSDVMNLEPQMAEDGEIEPCCEPLLTDADGDPGAAILHLAEHRLYRLIHWARQLPNFSGIETNDQIVLLQNSWANLLALFMCWQSTGSEHLVMNFGKAVSRKMATVLGMDEVFDRVEVMSEFFNTIGLEREEYVAIRLLILVNPDVDLLGDPLKVREFQEQFSEMLLFHTITYRAIESLRFTTILMKVQEIAHIGYLLHDWMLKRYDSYDDASRPQLTGLLVELLKHESVVGGVPGRLQHLQGTESAMVDDLVGVAGQLEVDDPRQHGHHAENGAATEVGPASGEHHVIGTDESNVVHVVVDQTHGILVTEVAEITEVTD